MSIRVTLLGKERRKEAKTTSLGRLDGPAGIAWEDLDRRWAGFRRSTERRDEVTSR